MATMATKHAKAQARLDPELLRQLSTIARALGIPQYEALEQAARDWIRAHSNPEILGLPGAPPQDEKTPVKQTDWISPR